MWCLLRCSRELGGRQIGRANANALSAESHAGEDHGTGGDLGAVSKRGGGGSAGAPRLLQQLLPVTLGLF